MPLPGASSAPDQHGVWQRIGASFSRSRHRPWPVVEDFLADLPPGARVLDLMAGNGRHVSAALRGGLDVVAADWSTPLAADCRAAGAEAVLADAMALPLADRSFDAAVYVAGLHGIPSAAGRRASLRELRRVLRPDAPVLVTVWAPTAPRFASMDLGGGPVDVEVPWRADGLDEMRTYHLYTPASLQADVEAAGFHGVAVRTTRIVGPRDNHMARGRA